MKQRVPRRAWSAPILAGRRPRLLVEDSRPTLAISDFSLFQDAGFDVAFCDGPGSDPGACPLLRGQQCVLVAGADVILHGLDPGLGIAAAIRHRCPELPVVVWQHRRQDGTAAPVPAGCVPLGYPCSVGGQIDALRRAEQAADHGRPASRQAPHTDRRPRRAAAVPHCPPDASGPGVLPDTRE